MAVVRRPAPAIAASSSRTTSAASSPSAPIGRSSAKGSPPSARGRWEVGASASPPPSRLRLDGVSVSSPPPLKSSALAPVGSVLARAADRAAASPAFSAWSLRIRAARGESSTHASAVGCELRCGERRGERRSVGEAPCRCGDAVAAAAISLAAATRST
eukprot:4465920-Pleurochrysis_carterae.AAC.1